MKFAGGTVRIYRQKQRVTATIDVGDVNAAVGADETKARLRDKHAVFSPDNRAALAQREFDDTCLEAISLCPRDGLGGGLYRSKINSAALSLGDYLVFDDENIATLEFQAARSQPLL